MLNGAITRIILRYLIGIFVAWAWFTPEIGEQLASDTDIQLVVETGLGLAAAAGVEWFYLLAKRWGWAT